MRQVAFVALVAVGCSQSELGTSDHGGSGASFTSAQCADVVGESARRQDRALSGMSALDVERLAALRRQSHVTTLRGTVRTSADHRLHGSAMKWASRADNGSQMSPFGNFVLRGCAAVAVPLVALAGCGNDSSASSSTTRAPHPAPTAAGDCNDLGAQREDGFVLARTDWQNDLHAYDEPAVVYVCVQPGAGGRVSLETSGQGITITPRSRATSSSETGVLAFRVRVRKDATGTLSMRQESPGAMTGGPGPTVVAETDRWHFASAE